MSKHCGINFTTVYNRVRERGLAFPVHDGETIPLCEQEDRGRENTVLISKLSEAVVPFRCLLNNPCTDTIPVVFCREKPVMVPLWFLLTAIVHGKNHMTFLPASPYPNKRYSVMDLPAGFHRVFQKIPQQGAQLRFADREPFRYTQPHIEVDMILPRQFRVTGTDGIEGEITGEGLVYVGRQFFRVSIQIRQCSVYIILLQIGPHHFQMLPEIVAGRFDFPTVLQELFVLCLLEIQKLFLYRPRFQKRRRADREAAAPRPPIF